MPATSLPSAQGSPAAVLGIGAYRPSRVIPNEDLVEAIDSSDAWIQQRTGIKARRFAAEEESVQSMAVHAAREALAHAGLAADQIDCVIVATVSHLMQTPAVATAVAHELGVGKPAAFDISAACAGFCHGLALADDMVRAGTARRVLVIGSERLSDITDLTDRGTAFLFADGAGAVVVGTSDEQRIGPTVWGSEGEHYDHIRQRVDWRDVIADAQAGQQVEVPALTMKGNAVFRWASFAMSTVAAEALDRAGITVDDLDVFVPHQANLRIVDAMRRTLKLPDQVQVADDIVYQGNTSAASIPLALHAMIADGRARSGDLALLIGFGAGLAYAAQVIVVP